MSSIKERIGKTITDSLQDVNGQISLDHPDVETFGDYSSNIALKLKGGREKAEEIASKIVTSDLIKKVEVAGPGFINIWLQTDLLINEIDRVLSEANNYGRGEGLKNKKHVVEYAHPNTHKEMHIGHMRTLITGEALARILEFNGSQVLRANYQGDIGPHVAKSIWGTNKLLKERKMSWEEAEKLSLFEKAHLLGEGYVQGSKEYETNQGEIDQLNKDLYAKEPSVMEDYLRTREWSLEYYDLFYKRFGTGFDLLSFESEVWQSGLEIVKENVGKIFTESEGAVVFKGEDYGLHTRVFITKNGTPTYEAKEMGLAYLQRKFYDYDKLIHVVANEQTGYFQVVIKTLSLIDSWFEGKQYHLPMGMVNLVGRKISSRKGDVITVDGLLEEVKTNSKELIKSDGKTAEEIDEIAEKVTLAAVKYSVLKTEPKVNAEFDLKQSVNLEGNSGPYLLYTYARIHSVIQKIASDTLSNISSKHLNIDEGELNEEEFALLRYIYRFPEVIEEAALRFGPNVISNYLYVLSSRFNSFYNKHSVIHAANENSLALRMKLALATGQIIKNGLYLLGIEVSNKM